MKRLMTIVAAVMATITTAHADMRPFARAGVWSVLNGTANDSGHRMCMMQTVWGRDRVLAIKWVSDGGLFLHVLKAGWRMPDQVVAVQLDVQFDHHRSWSLHGDGGGDSFQTSVAVSITSLRDDAVFKLFMHEFADADKMVVRFPGGTERPWVAELKGSETIAAHFKKCVDAVERDNTQPHQSAPGTPSNRGGV